MISEPWNDQFSVLMRSYPEVPLGWYIALLLASFIILFVVAATNKLFIPAWTTVIAIAAGCRS